MSDWNDLPPLTLASALGLFQPLNATLTTLSGKAFQGSGDIVLASAPTLANPDFTGTVDIGGTGSSVVNIANILGVNPLEIHTANALGIALYAHAEANFRGANIQFYRSHGVQATPTAVQNTDTLGYFSYGGWDGSVYYESVQVQGVATENWSGTNRGSLLQFLTTANGASVSSVKLTIAGDGTITATGAAQFGGINATPIGPTTPAAMTGTTGRFNSDLTLAGAPGKIKPAANSTTALQIAQADGTAFASWDTTNLRLGIRVTPTRSLGLGSGVANQFMNLDDTGLYFTRTVDAGENAIIGRDAAQSTTNSVALRYLAARHGFLVGATEMMVLSTSAASVGSTGVLSIDEIASITAITTPSNAGLLMTNDQAAATADGQIFNRTNRAAQTSDRFITSWKWNSVTQMTVANNGAVVINEQGNDADTRIEGDTDANLVYTDASTDRVGIGTATPNNKLDVVGTVQADGLRLDVTPTAETIVPTHTITISVNGTNYKIPLVAA